MYYRKNMQSVSRGSALAKHMIDYTALTVIIITI